MIIEFAGPPGAGKTTFEDFLRDALKDHNIDLLNRANLLEKATLSKVLNSISLWFQSAKLGISTGTPLAPFIPGYGAIYYWLATDLFLYDFYLKNYNSSQSVYLHQEGLIQHVAGAYARYGKYCQTALGWCAGCAENELMVVNLQVELESGYKRFIDRGIPNTWLASEKKESRNFYQRIVEGTQHSISKIESSPVRVERVENDLELIELQQKATELAESISRSTTG